MFLLILFIASLLAITIMIGVRIKHIREGRQFEHRPENRHLPDINLAAVRTTTIFYGKQFGHMLVLIALKGWIKVSYFVKRKVRALEPKIKKLLTPKRKRHLPQSENAVSQFLSSISEYKAKIKRAHDHMKREEEAKDLEMTGTL